MRCALCWLVRSGAAAGLRSGNTHGVMPSSSDTLTCEGATNRPLECCLRAAWASFSRHPDTSAGEDNDPMPFRRVLSRSCVFLEWLGTRLASAFCSACAQVPLSQATRRGVCPVELGLHCVLLVVSPLPQYANRTNLIPLNSLQT